MPLPTFSTSKEAAAAELSQRSVQLKQNCARWRGLLSNDDVSANIIKDEILRNLIVARQQLQAIAAKGAAAAAYYADLTGSTGAAVAAAFTELQNAVNAAISWITTTLPRAASSGTSYLAIETMDAQGTTAYRMFTPAQTAGLRTALLAIEAAINDPA